jgi:undecaprenyl-diphosphatase
MKITPVSALLIGVAQFFAACFPGISRSGSTISTGLMCKVSKKNAVRYSFILSVPAILASGLVEFKDAMEGAQVVPVFPLLVGIVTSAVVGVFAIRLLQVIITKNIFKYFGFYCLGLGFVVTIIGAIEVFVK